MCKVLLSIRPEHVENIFNGSKRFEFRKIRFKKDVSEIVIYCTHPVMKVVGKATVKNTIKCCPEEMWGLTEEFAGIDKLFFYEYYKGKQEAVALELDNVTEFDTPESLESYGLVQAPQSFVYL